MENPIFTLHGVVKAKGEMQDFVGPLALILQLLSKNKIEIKDISISLILEQYLAHLDKLQALDLEVASEFVSMASYLVYIKTKMLLAGDEAVEELNELISSLEELRRRDCYSQIRSVTQLLNDMYRSSYGMMIKPPEFIPPDNTYRFSHDIGDLLKAFSHLIEQEELSGVNPQKAVMFPKAIAYSVTEKASQILGYIKSCGNVGMRQLIEESRSRSEMVAVFIAVLELCRSGVIYVIGDDENMRFCSSGPDTIDPDNLPDFDETAE